MSLVEAPVSPATLTPRAQGVSPFLRSKRFGAMPTDFEYSALPYCREGVAFTKACPLWDTERPPSEAGKGGPTPRSRTAPRPLSGALAQPERCVRAARARAAERGFGFSVVWGSDNRLSFGPCLVGGAGLGPAYTRL